MAYMSQEKKRMIAAVLKTVMPKDWKYSLAVRHHSSIVMTVKSAPIPSGEILSMRQSGIQLNEYYPESTFSGKTLEIVNAAIAALNTDNHNRSDVQSDYFDVGHYIDLDFGKYDKPFTNTADVVLNTGEEVEVGDYVSQPYGIGNDSYKVTEIGADSYTVTSGRYGGTMKFAKTDLELQGKGYV